MNIFNFNMNILIIFIFSIIILLVLAVIYYIYKSDPKPEIKPSPQLTPEAKSGPVYTNVIAPTNNMHGTTVITNTDGSSLTQYGEETPINENDEHFQPYMSILTNDTYRSDAAFDAPLSKSETEIYGNYLQ